MIPNIDEENIQGEFTLKQIDAPMPEAPWIRRWTNDQHDNGCAIKFTDHILREGEDGEVEDNMDEDDTQGGVDISEIRDEFQNNDINEDLKPLNANKKQLLNLKDDHSPYIHSLELQ